MLKPVGGSKARGAATRIAVALLGPTLRAWCSWQRRSRSSRKIAGSLRCFEIGWENLRAPLSALLLCRAWSRVVEPMQPGGACHIAANFTFPGSSTHLIPKDQL